MNNTNAAGAPASLVRYFQAEPGAVYTKTALADHWRAEEAGLVRCLDGRLVVPVEMRRVADGWLFLCEKGYVWGVDDPRPAVLELRQDPERASRYLVVNKITGELVTTTRLFSPEAVAQWYAAQERAAHPVAQRAWQWTGGRPVKSLAEYDRSVASAEMSAANAASEARRYGR